MFWAPSVLAAVLVAMLVDRAIGDPERLWRRLPHPVVLIGRFIAWLEQRLRRPADNKLRAGRQGLLLVVLLVAGTMALGLAIQLLMFALPLGWLWLGLVVSTLLAQKSLIDHVRAVAVGLGDDLETGRQAVAHIVGRDTNSLDPGGVGRAAAESLAENLSDGVIAPLFWAALLGLPGLLAYKAINTADSMIGYKNETYRDFGRAAARLDDLVNLVPARLTALLLTVAATGLGSVREGLRIMWRDCHLHRSPNAGWPEAAMAGALGLKLSGPRLYQGRPSPEPWVGDGDPDVTPARLATCLRLADRVWVLALVLVLLLALVT